MCVRLTLLDVLVTLPVLPSRSVVGLVAFTIPFSFYMAYVEANHEHHHKTIYPHMKIRAKKFAWANSDCDIFDGECNAAANAARKASA